MNCNNMACGVLMQSILLFILGICTGAYLSVETQKFLEPKIIRPGKTAHLFKSDKCDLLEMKTLLKSARYSIGAEKLRLFYVHQFLSKPFVSVKIPKSLLKYKLLRKSAGVEIEESTTPCGMSPALAKFIRTPEQDNNEEYVYLNFISPPSEVPPVELEGLTGESIEVLFFPAFT